MIDVKIDSEMHKEYRKATPEECYSIDNLICGFHDLLEKVYSVDQ